VSVVESKVVVVLSKLGAAVATDTVTEPTLPVADTPSTLSVSAIVIVTLPTDAVIRVPWFPTGLNPYKALLSNKALSGLGSRKD